MDTITPSRPGYAFSTADLARADVSPLEAARLIVANREAAAQVAGDGGADPELKLILAAMLRAMKRANCRYQPFPFDFPIWTQQQVLTSNPLREYLMIQNVGNGDLLVVFEETSVTATDFSAASAQSQLTNKQTRALRIVSGGYFEPLTPPTNAISIFTLNAATNGIVIDGT